MAWNVGFHSAFDGEFDELGEEVQDEILALMGLLQEFGPNLARPHVDTLNGSKYANLIELRFKAADGVWRVAFAFDPQREAILLVAGDKSGGRFYKDLIAEADARFGEHLAELKAQQRRS